MQRHEDRCPCRAESGRPTAGTSVCVSQARLNQFVRCSVSAQTEGVDEIQAQPAAHEL